MAREVAGALQGLGRISVRRLGATYALSHEALPPDVPVGVVFGGALFLKAGPETVTRYIARGMRPFRPGPRQPLRGYWRVPIEVLAEPQQLRAWADAALDAARRFGRRRRAPRRRRRRTKTG